MCEVDLMFVTLKGNNIRGHSQNRRVVEVRRMLPVFCFVNVVSVSCPIITRSYPTTIQVCVPTINIITIIIIIIIIIMIRVVIVINLITVSI